MRDKVYIRVCAGILAVLMLTGCTGRTAAEQKYNQDRPASDGAPAQVDTLKEKPFPITEERYDLRIMVQVPSQVLDLLTNSFTMEYEAKTNVHVDWDIVCQNAVAEKLNLALGAQKELPDVFLNMEISNNQVVSYGVDRKILVDLKSYIEKYAPNIRKMLDYNPMIRKAVTAPDGGIYTLPSFEESFHTCYPQKAWIYKPWLDTLELELPTNLDELEVVLTAFRDQDPNRNGKKDEIPMTGAVTGWMTKPLYYLMCPFIYADQEEMFNVDASGSVSAPFEEPQWREGLSYIHRLCAEGLLDPRAFFQDLSQLKQITMYEGNNIVGVVTAGAPGGFMSIDHPRWEDWIALPPMMEKNGSCVTATKPLRLDIGKFAVTRECEDPAVAVRWIDYFYSEEGTLRATCGVEGRDWRWAEEGEIGLNGKQGKFVRITPFVAKQNSHWGKMVPYFQPDSMRNYQVEVSDHTEQMLYDVTARYYEKYGVENVMYPLFFPPESVEELEKSVFLISDYVQDASTRFILGEWDVDNQKVWDRYLSELQGLGLPNVLDQYTEVYRQQYVR